jgi:DNA-binding NarL/FixJ family response regulator
MDLRMPVMGGVEATRRLRAQLPETRVLVLTTFEEDEEVLAAIQAGAAATSEGLPSEKLVEAIRTVVAGGSPLEPTVAAKLMTEFNRLSRKEAAAPVRQLAEPLSTRELDVLKALCEASRTRRSPPSSA